MKKILTFVMANSISLSGCQFIENAKTLNTFGANPLFHALSQSGANKQSLNATGIEPQQTRATSYIKGTCSDYRITQDGKTEDMYVGMNEKEQVVAYGFSTCDAAEANGGIRSSAPPKQIY
jgi:hypothetical protein